MTVIDTYRSRGRHRKCRTRRSLAARLDHPIVQARVLTITVAYAAGVVAAIFGGVL